MPEHSPHPGLLFFPPKVQAMAQQWQSKQSNEILLQKDLNTPDWSLEHLWLVAAYYHLHLKFEQAMPYYQRMLEWTRSNAPEHGEILASIGHVFLFSKMFQDARKTLELSLRFNPEYPNAYYYLTECYLRDHQESKAIQALNKFLQHYPHKDLLCARAGRILSHLLDRQGAAEAAAQHLKDLAERLHSWAFEIQAATYQPPLPPWPEEQTSSQAPTSVEIPTETEFYGEEFAECYLYRQGKTQTHLRPVLESWGTALQSKVKAFLGLEQSPAIQKQQSDQRLLILGDFQAPEAAAYLDPIIALARDRSITVLTTTGVPALFRQEEWMRILPCTSNLEHMYNAVTSHEPDLLLYLNLGPQQPNQLALASQHLAKTQAVLGAAAVTTGLPSIQYYLSLDCLEAENAEAHYSEELVRLQGTPLANVWLPDQYIARSSFQLPETGALYFCPQSIQELHAQMFVILNEILAQDPQGHIFVLGSGNSSLDRQFQNMMQERSPEQNQRLHILKPLPDLALLSLMRCMDLILDPIYLGLRHKAWQYICLGTPIVSHCSDYAAGRYVASLYRQMGWQESLVNSPQEYAQKASKLAQDSELKARLQTKLEAERSKLFQANDFVQSLAEFVDKHCS